MKSIVVFNITIYIFLTITYLFLFYFKCIKDDYQRAQSSSVSPRGTYCSNTSTPHSSGGGSYGSAGNGYGTNMGTTLSTSPASVFNSTSSKFY